MLNQFLSVITDNMNRNIWKCLVIFLVWIKSSSSQYNFRVTENQPPSTFVGQVLIKSGFIYDFLHKENVFTFNQHTGIIHTSRAIDRESLPSDLVEVLLYKKSQEGQFMETISIKVRIVDENDNAPIFHPSRLERRVVENIAIFTDISLAVARDADTDEFGVSNNYKIESGNEEKRFSLVGIGVQHRGQLLLRVVRPLDRESKDRYSLVISVDDRGQPPLRGVLQVEIVVEDYNDNSPVFSPSKYTVRLNESSPPGHEVVRVFASDADLGANKLVEYRFKKTRSTSQNEFSIEQKSGSITLSRRTSCHVTPGDCTLVVEAFDLGSPSLSAYCYVSIDVIKLNSFRPTLKINYVNSADGTAYIEMGKITKRPLAIVHCQDEDQDVRDVIALSIIAGNEEKIFTLERTHGNVHILRQTKQIKDSNVQQYVVVVRAVDNGSPPRDTKESVRIKVNKANVHHPIFERKDHVVNISRSLPVNSFIARFVATDKDPGPNGKVTYAISNGNNDEIFSIDKEFGLVVLVKSLWFVSGSQMSLQIVAKDSGINSLETVGSLRVWFHQPKELRAKFSIHCQQSFILDNYDHHGLMTKIFIYNFLSQLEMSDHNRRNDVQLKLVSESPQFDDSFKLLDGDLFMDVDCRDAEIIKFYIVILQEGKLLDKLLLTVEITPRISSKLCHKIPATYAIKLPELFDYNLLIGDLRNIYPTKFPGQFTDVSSDNHAFHVSSHGSIYWTQLAVPQVVTTLQIKYNYIYLAQVLSEDIVLYIYPYFSEKQIMSCSKLDMISFNRPGKVLLTSISIEDISNDDVKFFLPQSVLSRHLYITNNTILISKEIYDTSPTPENISLTAYSPRFFHQCSLNIFQHIRFDKGVYYFKTKEINEGAPIGVVSVIGQMSSMTVMVSGMHSQYFRYDTKDMTLYLMNSLRDKGDARIMEIRLRILNSMGTKTVSTVDVIIEFCPSLVSPIFSDPFYTFVIAENASTHSPLSKIALSSTQNIENYDLKITDESFYGKWSIFPDGAIYLLSNLDYEERKNYSFAVLASSQKDRDIYSKVFVHVVIQDCNDNSPRFNSSSYYFEVCKDAKLDSIIGKVFAIDADSGLNGLIEYSICQSSAELQFVDVDPMSGVLRTNGVIETVDEDHLQFYVTATDGGNPSLSTSVKIYVKIIPTQMTQISFYPQTYFIDVLENMTVGQEILTVKASAKSPVVYHINKWTHRGMFSIDRFTGKIRLAGPVDRETVTSSVLTIIASDPSSGEQSDNIAVVNVHVRIADANDNSPVFQKHSLKDIVLSESTKIGMIIWRYQAEDIDDGLNGMIRYQISGSDMDLLTVFKIDPFSGVLYLNRALDYEYKFHWIFNITASDMGSPKRHTDLSITVSVTNENDNKPRFIDDILVQFNVRRDSPVGTTVGRVFARDADKNEIEYSLRSVEPRQHPFKISGHSGILTIGQPIMAEESYNVVVMATDVDRRDWFTLQYLKVDVKSDKEGELSILTHGAIVLPRSVFFGDKIATIHARYHPNGQGLRLAYQIINCSLDSVSINRYTGDIFIISESPVRFNWIDLTVLVSLESLQSENVVKYHSTKLILDQDDSHNLNFQKNEYILPVSECDAVKGSKLLRLQALYPGNPISDFQYFISDIYAGIPTRIKLPNTMVTLNKDTGWLSIGLDNFDREQIEGSQVTIEAVVIDRAKNVSRSTKVFLNIIDCNDNIPIFYNETFVFRVPENSSQSEKLYVGTVYAEDKDIDSVLVYSWIEKEPRLFVMEKDSGIITTTGTPLDYERESYFPLRVQATDGRFTSSANVLIIVENMNDECHEFSRSNYRFDVKENAPVHTIIGQVSMDNARHSWNSARIKFSLVSEWGSHLFSVHPEHGIITTSNQIDYEQESHYILLIVATDISEQSLFLPCAETVTTTVLVSIVDINDNAPVFDSDRVFMSVSENVPLGSVIVKLVARDRDQSDLLQFEITSPNDELFAINSLTGVLVTAGSLDYEKSQKHLVTVVCSDGMHVTVANIEIVVINENDERPEIHNKAQINLPLIGEDLSIFIKCSDKDHLGALSYDVVGPATVPPLSVNQSTGRIIIGREIFKKMSLKLLLICTDSLHRSSANVTVVIGDRKVRPIITRADLSIDNRNPQASLSIRNSVSDYPIFKDKCHYSLAASKDELFHEDWNFFNINTSSGQLTTLAQFSPKKFQYKMSIIVMSLNQRSRQLHIDLSVRYRNINTCNPRYIGTPYLFRVQAPVYTARLLGLVAVGYCSNYTSSYYLSSGHSFFTVNSTSGQMFVNRDPPFGIFRYKVTSVINTDPKSFLSTVITVLTLGPRTKSVTCQFSVLRIVLKTNTSPGSNVGQISITNLPTDTMISFQINKNWPLSISKDGRLTTSTMLTHDQENPIKLFVLANWWDQTQSNSLTCPVEITVVTGPGECVLALSYPSSFLELQTFRYESTTDQFIFGIPVAHQNCEMQVQPATFHLENPTFRINRMTGELSSRNVLIESKYEFSVKISSINATKELIVPVRVHVIDRVTGVDIIYENTPLSIFVDSNSKIGSSIGSVQAKLSSSIQKWSWQYSLVYFCCIYPSNIAVYNGSIYQSPFAVSRHTGSIFLHRDLPPVNSVYTIRIRTEVRTEVPIQYLYKDIEIKVVTDKGSCRCNYLGSFEGNVEENSETDLVLVKTPLLCNKKKPISVSIWPQWAQRLVQYDIGNNAIMTTQEPIDRERNEFIDIVLNVTDAGGRRFGCPGIIRVLDLNDNAPRFTLNYFMGSVSEDAPIGTWIIDIGVIDRDSNLFPLKFNIVGDETSAFFINPMNGSVFLSRSVDREQRWRYEMKVAVSDGVHVLETGILIIVADMNDNAPRISTDMSNKTFVINNSELSRTAVFVTTIVATDNDDPLSNNSKIRYSVTSDNSKLPTRSLFIIDESTGDLSIMPEVLNWVSVNETVDIIVTATDKGQPALSHASMIHLFFVHEEYELRISSNTFLEPVAVLHTNIAGSPVVTLSIDQQSFFHGVTYRLVSGNGTSFFSLDAQSGKIATRTNIKSAVIGSWFALQIQACGYRKLQAFLFCSKRESIVFIISDFNLYSPRLRINQAMVSVPESTKVGMKLLQIDVIDQDVGISGVVRITILQPLDGTFSLMPTSSEQSYHLVLSAPLDYEKVQQYSVVVSAYDLGSPKRSQISNILINIIDEDDNAPYFTRSSFIVRIADPTALIDLPLVYDDDSEVVYKEPVYTFEATKSADVKLHQSKNQFSVEIVRWPSNESLISLNLHVSGSTVGNYTKDLSPGRYSSLLVYLILSSFKVDPPQCSYKRKQSDHHTYFIQTFTSQPPVNFRRMYHLLVSYPPSSSQYVSLDQVTGQVSVAMNNHVSSFSISVSNGASHANEYDICHVSLKKYREPSRDLPTLLVQNIIINSNRKTGDLVGRVSVSQGNEKLQFRLYSRYYLPFSIHDSGQIFTRTSIYSSYPAVYNIKVVASNARKTVDSLSAEFSITLRVDSMSDNVIPVSISVRENIGDDAILGSLQSVIENHFMDIRVINLSKEFFEEQGKLQVDRKGIIRVKRPIDREKTPTLRVIITANTVGKTEIIELTVSITDENDSPSSSRNVQIAFSVVDNLPRLNRLIRLIPADKDAAGDYTCRLHTLNVPQGALLTPDCWLHVLDELQISKWRNSSAIRVTHHDGRHKAVISNYQLKVSRVPKNAIDSNYVILNVSNIDQLSVIANIKSVEYFLLSLKCPLLLIAIDAPNRHLVLWSATTSTSKLSSVMKVHHAKLETLLGTKITEITEDLCDDTSCSSHGSCATSITINHDDVFNDNDVNTVREVNVYPSVNIESKCACDKGYLGKRCNLAAKCHHQQICQNGGTCGMNRDGQLACECLPGYMGVSCDQDNNECERPGICSTHGSCINSPGTFKCECHLHWIGNNYCTQPMNQCPSNPCATSGTEQCVPTVGGYKCHCRFGNYGDKCHLSAISFKTESFLQIEFAQLSRMSLEFSTIQKESSLMTIIVSSSVIIQISLSRGCLRVTIFEDSILISQRDSSQPVSTGKWWKLKVYITLDRVSASVLSCGHLTDCEASNEIYPNGASDDVAIISLPINKYNSKNPVRVLIGSSHAMKLPGYRYFVGCVRNMQLQNASVIRKEEKNLLHDSCPRYEMGLAPCSQPTQDCGGVGKCIDEWFVARCQCPSGYQPPQCTAGYPAFQLTPNTIVSFVRRLESLSSMNSRRKRAIVHDSSEISLRLKTRDANSVILMSLSSFHSYTLVQIENGFIKVTDKYAGSSQEMLHKAVVVNDDKIHVVNISRESTGTIIVTVDSVIALVNWLQSHDIIGPSVHTLYLAGLPQDLKAENYINIPNFSGCMSDVRFNNKTMPLEGLTRQFNVSILQGSLAPGCSSGVCMQQGICEKYQVCKEVTDIPHGLWGQYSCMDDNRHRLLSILLPVMISVLLLVVLSVLIYVVMKRRNKKLKSKSSMDQLKEEIHQSGKGKSKDQQDSKEKADLLHLKNQRKTPRSATSSTLLMQEFEKSSHPDLIRSHEVMFEPDKSGHNKSKFDSLYYHDNTIVNPYMSSGNMTVQRDYRNRFHKNPELLQTKNLKSLNFSTGMLQPTDDSLVYQCSHPDDYEAVGSRLSSNTSQDRLDNPKFPFAYRFQTQGIRPEYFAHSHLASEPIVHRHGDIRQSSSSSSNKSHLMPQKMTSAHRIPFLDSRKSDDVFSNTDSNLTGSPQIGLSVDSLSSSANSENVFTPTNSSDSIASNKNSVIPSTNACWKNIQRALPPPPPTEDHYEYADMKTT